LIRTNQDEFSDHEIELAHNPQRNGDAILPEAANYQHSPTTTALPDGSGSENSAAVSRVSSRRIPVDV
jgi:hypothetical protein